MNFDNTQSKRQILPEILSLSEILIPVKGEYLYEEKEGRCITVEQLSATPFKYELKVEDVKFKALEEGFARVSQAVLLIAIDEGVKVGFCMATKECPVFIAKNIYAYHIKRNDMHVGYLVYHMMRKNAENETELLNLQIEFPSFNANELNSRYKAYKKSAINELGLQDVVDDEIEGLIKKVRLRKHDIRSVLSQLSFVEKRMRRCINDNTLSDLERKMMINERLNSYQKAMNRLNELIELLPKEEEFGNPELINLDKFLYDYWLKYDEDDEWFTLEYDCLYDSLSAAGISVPSSNLTRVSTIEDLKHSKNETYQPADANVLISENDLRVMLDCIVDNAKNHGLCGRADCDGIFIYLKADSTHKFFQIDIVNDGNPLPKGMTKERYGTKGEKAGHNGNTGLGGYRVKSIVEHYKGDYDIFSEYIEEFDCHRTVVRIYLPIAR